MLGQKTQVNSLFSPLSDVSRVLISELKADFSPIKINLRIRQQALMNESGEARPILIVNSHPYYTPCGSVRRSECLFAWFLKSCSCTLFHQMPQSLHIYSVIDNNVVNYTIYMHILCHSKIDKGFSSVRRDR